MPSILFRADAEKSIGIGDLMSTIYLSHVFKNNSWQCFFIVRDYDPALKILKNYKLENVYLIPHDYSIAEEIRFIKKFCKDNSIDCLFMEITKNKLTKYKNIDKPVPIMACINFDGIITNDFDVVINWCVDSSDNLYENYQKNNMQFILGFENTVLPHFFDWNLISSKTVSKEVKKILISMGGIDEFNLTDKIVKAIKTYPNKFELRIIVGAGYEKKRNLTQFMNSAFEKFTIKQNVDNLLEDYLWADMAFSAGGLTSSELIAAKTPAMLVTAYPHQIKRCEYYAAQGWVDYSGYKDDIDEIILKQRFDAFLRNIHQYQEKLRGLDFRGGNERIFKNIDSCR